MPRLRADGRGLAEHETDPPAPTMNAPLTSLAPPRARRDRLLALAPFAVLGAWTALVTLLLARHALDNHYVFRDEANAIVLGRIISHDLSQAVTGTVARGPERMTSLFAAVAAKLADGPARQVELLHVWAAVCQGLVTVPVWLAARNLRLGRWQALVPMAIASAGSFAFFGIFTLNTSIGVLSGALLLWAMIRALRRPGLASDLLVISALGLLVLSRIGWAPLAAALAPAVLAAVWFDRPAGEHMGSWLGRLPRRLLQRHPLLLPLALLLLVVALIAGPSTLLGGEMYGGVRLQPHIELAVLWDNTRILGAHLAIGLAVVPLVLALPLVVRGLVRPADGLEGGFAWLVLTLLVVFSYAYYFSMNEDRYFAILVPPLALAAALAVFRRPPPLWSVAASGALVVALVATSYDWPFGGPYDYFIAPTSRFLGDVVVGKLTQHLPGSAELWAALVTAGAGAVALLVTLGARRSWAAGRSGRVAAGVALAGVLAFQLAAMDHPERKFTQLVGMEAVNAAQLELLDRGGGGEAVQPLAVNGLVDPDLAAQLQILEAYNSSLSLTPYAVGISSGVPGQLLQGTIDWTTGRIRGQPPTPLLLELAGQAPIGFVGTLLPTNPAFPWAQLVRPEQPLRLSWYMRGIEPDRYPQRGHAVVVRVYPGGSRGRCLTGIVLAHPFARASVRYRLAGSGHSLQGVLTPTVPRPIALPVSNAHPTTFRLTGQARQLPDGAVRGPTLSDLAVKRCPRR
jgi:hypothetical protein